ncbi:MAG TPA: hypothetical protein VK281_15660, partial [Xanthobacteraceae bacterium]|nr:hypothetical protein [Xanthobacteraceae bacterium]
KRAGVRPEDSGQSLSYPAEEFLDGPKGRPANSATSGVVAVAAARVPPLCCLLLLLASGFVRREADGLVA